MNFRTLVLLAVICMAFPGAKRAAAEPPAAVIKVAYEGYLGPLYLMSAKAEISLKAGAYRVSTSGKTEGFANWFFSWKNRAVSEGTRSNQIVVPASFQMNAFWNDKARKAKMQYADRGASLWSYCRRRKKLKTKRSLNP
jgi:hypothetical protein